MKEFLMDYIEEILFFSALLFIVIGAFTISLSVGLFTIGLMLIVAENKIVKIKKSLAERK